MSASGLPLAFAADSGACSLTQAIRVEGTGAFITAVMRPCLSARIAKSRGLFRECARVVDTLRPEKSGQARVFAYDGSEFTAGQALWMQGQLRKVERLCAQGTPASQAEATSVLVKVQELLKEHQRT